MPLATSSDLTALNTLGLHAHADYLYRMSAPDDLLALLADPTLRHLPRYVLGGGSNLVLPARVPGVVLKVEVPGRAIIAQDAEATYVAPVAAKTGMSLCNGPWRKAWPGWRTCP